MTDKLLNCPFCGGKAILKIKCTKEEKYPYQVYCISCFCGTDEMTHEDDAIKAWNTRKPIDRIVEQLEKLRQEYPYKVVGEYDTYSTYNEAWSDCSDRAIAIVKGVQNE